MCFYVDSRGALESLNSKNPVFNDLVVQCKNIILELSNKGRNIRFSWLPSHVGLEANKRADKVAKEATRKDTIDIECDKTLKQIKTEIRAKQIEYFKNSIIDKYNVKPSNTMQHYLEVAQKVTYRYGRNGNKWKDTVCTKLRLGLKYYWEIGVECEEEKTRCRLCRVPLSHTLRHYVLNCPVLTPYRNPHIYEFTKQVIWMFNRGKVRKMLFKQKNIRNVCDM